MRMWPSLPRGSCESLAYLLLVSQLHTLAGPFCNKVAGMGTKQEEVAGVRSWDCCVASDMYYPSLDLLNSLFLPQSRGEWPFTRIPHPWDMLTPAHGLPDPEIRSAIPSL